MFKWFKKVKDFRECNENKKGAKPDSIADDIFPDDAIFDMPGNIHRPIKSKREQLPSEIEVPVMTPDTVEAIIEDMGYQNNRVYNNVDIDVYNNVNEIWGTIGLAGAGALGGIISEGRWESQGIASSEQAQMLNSIGMRYRGEPLNEELLQVMKSEMINEMHNHIRAMQEEAIKDSFMRLQGSVILPDNNNEEE